MTDNIRNTAELFIANRDALKKAFKFDSSFMYYAGANTLTAEGVTADTERLKECKKIMNKSVSSISYLRMTSDMPLITAAYLADDPEAEIKKIENIYKIMKKHFSRSDYLALLAILSSSMTDEAGAENIASRGKRIYELMKKEHPILTSSEDSIMAGFMAFSDKKDEELTEDCEKCFELLKSKFSHKQTIQTCSHILSLGDADAETKVNRVIGIFDTLKEAGYKYSKYHELAVLASLAITDVSIKELTDTITEFDKFLAEQKGYGTLSMDKKTRLMHAAMLTADIYGEPAGAAAGSAASLAAAIAQEAAICVMIACCAASSTAAATN